MLMRLKVSVFCFSFISRCATGIRPIRAVFVLYAHRKFYWTVPFKCTFSQATLSNFLKICHKDFQLFSSICRKNERHKRLRNAGRLKMQDWKMRHHQKYHQKFPNLLWIVVVLSHAFILTMCLYVYMCVCVCMRAWLFAFYRAMHFSAKRGIAIACRLSVWLWRWWIVITYVGILLK